MSATKLPRAARQRLADVLAGRAEPTPILHEAPAGLRSRFRATWAALLAMVALTTCTAIGFADPRAAFAYQPTVMMVPYVAAMMLLGYALLALHRRRALASGSSLAPGRYLLPLDVVEVPAPDAEGEQVIVVTPLGDARDARVRSRGKKSELVIVLDRGAELTFALREERVGETALRRLEHAQTLLEQLTYARDLEKSLANDAFFDVRVDDSWAAVAPAGPASKRTRRHQRLLHGAVATTTTLAVAAALGGAAFLGRNWASDRALYLRALRLGTTEALDAYLTRGTAHHEDASSLRARLELQRVELARHAADSRARAGFDGLPRAAWELTPEESQARSGTIERCVVALRVHGSTTQPNATPILEALVRRAGRTGDNVIPVRMFAEENDRPASAPALDVELRSATVLWALERIFSETCPATFVKLARRPLDRASIGEPGFDVRTVVTWPAKRSTWKVHGEDVVAPTLAFAVTLRGVALDDVITFNLTMSPPDAPPVAVRERSLFVVPPGDANVYPLLTARAFDRLYDELYGLVYAGDPRVPLHEPASR